MSTKHRVLWFSPIVRDKDIQTSRLNQGRGEWFKIHDEILSLEFFVHPTSTEESVNVERGGGESWQATSHAGYPSKILHRELEN